MARTQRARHERNYRAAVLLLAACALTAVSACSADNPEPKKSAAPPSKSSPAPETVSPEDKAQKELLADYGKYQDAITQAYAKASVKGTELSKYATGTAFARAQGEMEILKQNKQVFIGKLTGKPAVEDAAIDLERKVPKATFEGCVDVSGWKLVDKDSKKEVKLPDGRLSRYITAVKAEKWGDHWVVLEETPQKEKC